MRVQKFVWRIAPLIIVIVLLTGANAASDLLLSRRDRHIIKIAFMNGSIEMLEMDLKDLETLKTDEAMVRRLVESAAERYVKRVDHLSRTENRIDRGGGSRYTNPY